MKINRLSINNFKGVETAVLVPQKLTAFIGENGVGKSSTEKAIIYGLSGTLPDDPIMHGKGQMSVSMELDSGDSFTRMYVKDTDGFKTKITLNNRKNVSQKKLEEQIMGATGVNAKSMQLVTSSELLHSLKAEEFGEFIMRFLNERFDFNKMISYCGTISDEAVEKLKSYTTDGDEYVPQTGDFGLEEVDNIYYQLASSRNKNAERAALKAKINMLKARAAYDGPIPKRQVEEIDAMLTEIAKTEGSYQMALIAKANYQKSINAIQLREKQMEELKKQIADIVCERPNETNERNIRNRIIALTSSISNTERMAHTIRMSMDKAKDMLANLSKNECLCFEGLLCTTDKTCKKAELESQIQDCQESLQISLKEIEKMKEEKQNCEKALNEYNINMNLYSRKLLLEKQLHNIVSNPIQAPIKPVEVEQRDFSVEKLSLTKEKEMILKYNQCMKESEELTRREKELEVMEEIIDIFKPKGIFRQNVINYYLNGLEQVINAEASKLKPDFALKFNYDEGVHILCEAKHGQGFLPWHSISSGEQVFVLYLIMDLLNSLTGVGVLIMDDLNHLDKNAIKSLLELLDNPDTQNKYDHIFVSSVNNKEIVDALKTTGFNVIHL